MKKGRKVTIMVNWDNRADRWWDNAREAAITGLGSGDPLFDAWLISDPSAKYTTNSEEDAKRLIEWCTRILGWDDDPKWGDPVYIDEIAT